MKKMLFILLISLLSYGCASIRTDSSNPSLQSPVLTKAEKTSVHLEMGSSDRLKFTDDASARPPVIEQMHSRSNDLRANLAYGINNNWDISAGLTSSIGFNMTSRVRLAGDDKSKWSTAGTLFVNVDSSTKDGDQNGEFGPGGYNWKATASTQYRIWLCLWA